MRCLYKKSGSLFLFTITIIYSIYAFIPAASQAAPVSDATEECLGCHGSITPGIVSDWQNSRHSKMTPAEALTKPDLEKRISSSEIPENLTGVAVGCAECHLISPDEHEDTFDHADYKVHTVVTPKDCAVCHKTEADQYSENIMSFANVNLTQNDLYQTMINSVNGLQHFTDNKLVTDPADQSENLSSCLSCHGTEMKVDGTANRETALGEMEFPVLIGWPNQGVGRINPDGSFGACSACHTRHQFSIETARKPYTCAQCHKGPDVPAYPVYQVSKHGNIFYSENKHWDFNHVPWTIGSDLTAPTCAVCHVSLLVNNDGEVIAQRTHRMNDRLAKRLFGLIYAHPHPISANTSIIENSAGIQLPTELDGQPVDKFLIDADEQAIRLSNMKKVCLACHSSQWTDNHFNALDSTIAYTNNMTKTATALVATAWNENLAEGLPQESVIFDEAIEKMWTEQWLFYANSTRFAAAMMGADYGVFANGRWYLSKNLRDMYEWLEVHRKLKEIE